MLQVIHRYEPDTALHWLEFPGKPDEATRSILKKAGWRFIGAVMQWRKAGLLTSVPDLPGYQVVEGGEVDHAEARAAHYEARAEKAEARRAEAHEQVNAIARMIPLGQPILVGHHSEGRHWRDLARIDKGVRRAIEEGRKAERLHDRAEASERQQQRKHDPGAIYRKLEETRKRYRLYQDAKSGEDARRRDVLAAEIARLEAELDAVGGLPADHIELHKGDLILLHGFLVEIARLNRKTITGYLIHPVHNLFSPESNYTRCDKRCPCTYDRSYFGGHISTASEWATIKAGRTQAEAYALAEAHLKQKEE